jgi:uroporphyrinogen decarboxylase
MGEQTRYTLSVSADAPLLRAARRESTSYTPIWLMRQAGRYMPEYRAMRARFDFLDLCKNPEAAAEVTLQPVERLGVDAAILFADILLIVEPLGVGLTFGAGEGPVIARPVRSDADVARLRPIDVESAVGFVFDTVTRVKKALADRVPLIGFAGAPFTVASYVVEGGASRDYLNVKRLMYEAPAAWQRLMELLVDATARYLNGQIVGGAEAVQVFDSWVGALAPEDYRAFVLPHMKALFAKIAPGVPAIHFGTGTAALLPLMRQAGGQVIGLDWRVDLADGWRAVGHDVAVQGNLDPAVLLAAPAYIRKRTRAVLDAAAGRPGHIFNLGHGIHKDTPVAHVKALVDIVHELSDRR